MKRSLKGLSAASILALAAAASPAFAAGTQSGTTITNIVTVNYKVGGITQTAEEASDTLTVDRKVNLTVAENGNTTTQVSPGQTSAVTAFTVTNTSNDTLDLGLEVSQLSGGSAAHGGMDTFDVTNLKMYLDVNGDGLLDDGDTLITTGYLDEVAPDTNIKVLVVGDIPVTPETGDVAGVRLTATALAGGSAGSQGAVLTETTGANTSGVDTVFVDTNANGNIARDGKDFATDDYTVLAAALTAVKSSRVISDPQNGTSDPKAIPGAVIQYCIAITNAVGSATAMNVAVTDPVPTGLTFVPGSIHVNGTVNSSGVCQGDGSAGGDYTGTTVTGPLTDLAAGQTRTVVFQATVD
ncbi:hypothetical protein [Tsuneonella suprasediminis]|uniref:hypothetical protein n=1 Tax=Tsuneonella suprasediminis TaxID=2306996 RepID=UPI002F94101D